MPGFLQVLDAILYEMVVERATVAEELQSNATFIDHITSRLVPVDLQMVNHEDFKKRTAGVRAIIRTGEWTPYANIILYAGVAF